MSTGSKATRQTSWTLVALGLSQCSRAELSSQQPKHPGENGVCRAGPCSANPRKDVGKVVNLTDRFQIDS